MVRLRVGQDCGSEGYPFKLAAAAMFALACAASPANAEMQIGVYGGWNDSFDSDIHLSSARRHQHDAERRAVGWQVLRPAALLGRTRHLLVQ